MESTRTEMRFLITTADERTWRTDRPVIFLGEWCRRHARRHLWGALDAVVAAPFGRGASHRDELHRAARELEVHLFPVVCEVVERLHGQRHSARFWQIVFGHWFRRYSEIIVNRVGALRDCLANHHIDGTATIDGDEYCLATLDSYAAILASNDDSWNSALDGRILRELPDHGVRIQNVPADETRSFRVPYRPAGASGFRGVLQWGYRKCGRLLERLVRDEDALIIGSYLSKPQLVALQAVLGQVPQLWGREGHPVNSEVDRVLRHRLAGEIRSDDGDTLGRIARALVFELMPVCYLEGYGELEAAATATRWPARARLIFTSNCFDTDERFKAWAARRVEAGARYVVGQHGNNYGTHRYMDPSIEESAADQFLTWGWTDGLKQHTPLFILKSAGRRRRLRGRDGELLLVEVHHPHRLAPWDEAADFQEYFGQQTAFVRALQEGPRSRLKVRLHSASRDLRFDEAARWAETPWDVRVDSGDSTIGSLIARSRLVVHSYDSTGILETLSQNLPTLAFWANGLDHLRDGAKPYYQALFDVGIFFEDATKAADKVNAVWEDVHAWWNRAEVQAARVRFCSRYARTVLSPTIELRDALTAALPTERAAAQDSLA